MASRKLIDQKRKGSESSPRAAGHIQAKPPVREDGTFPLTAISYDNRVFSDVFGPHFPRAAIHQRGGVFCCATLHLPLARIAWHAKPSARTEPSPARNQLQQPHVQRYCQPIFSTHSCSPTEASLLLLDLRSSPRTARHIRAKPPVRADGFFFLTAISHDSRMFSDVFGPHFPAASSPRAHGKRSASYMLCPANLFPFRMRSVMATANSRDASRFLSAVDWTDAQKQRCQRAKRRTSRA